MDSKNTPDSVELPISKTQPNTSNDAAPEPSKVPESVFVVKDNTVLVNVSDGDPDVSGPDFHPSGKAEPGDEVVPRESSPISPDASEPSGPAVLSDQTDEAGGNLPKEASAEEKVVIPPPLAALPEESAAAKSGAGKKLHSRFEASPSRTILAFVLMLFILLVLFIAGIVQFDGTFILAADARYTAIDSDFLVRNRVFDPYRKTYKVSVSLETAAPTVCTTQSVTVGKLVERLYPDLGRDGKLYEFSYDLYTIIEDDMELAIDLVEYVEREEIREKEFTTQEIGLETIPKGTVVVLQEGVNGTVRQKLKDKYVNGVLSDSFLVGETILVEPVTQIENVGIGGVYTTSSGGKYAYSYYVDVEATAYGVDTGYGGDNTHTKTGTVARKGVIAVDPEVIPFHSKVLLVYESGRVYGVCYAEDAGYSIVDNRIDIYMGDDIEAQTRFGRRKMRAYVLE